MTLGISGLFENGKNNREKFETFGGYTQSHLADSFIIILSIGKDLPYSLYKSRLQFTPYQLTGLLYSEYY